MGARELVKHVLSLVGLADVSEARRTPCRATITVYDSRKPAPAARQSAEARR